MKLIPSNKKEDPFNLKIVNPDNAPVYWVYFKPIRTNNIYKYPDLWMGAFVWDWVPFKIIEKYLKQKNMDNVDSPWQISEEGKKACLLNTEGPEWKIFHAKRIADIVNQLKEFKIIKPCDLEFCPSSLEDIVKDGHHRIRALEYLGFDGFPAVISGYMSYIDEGLKFGLLQEML